MVDFNFSSSRPRRLVFHPVTLALVITGAALALAIATAGGWAAGAAVAASACGLAGLAAGFANSGST